MFTKVIYSLTNWFLIYLRSKGVDTKSIEKPVSKQQEQWDQLMQQLVVTQGKLSEKRAEILDEQKELLLMMEPIIFSYLSSEADSWQKGVLTKNWVDKVSTLNNKVNEHEQILRLFDETYHKLEQLNKEKNEIQRTDG